MLAFKTTLLILTFLLSLSNIIMSTVGRTKLIYRTTPVNRVSGADLQTCLFKLQLLSSSCLPSILVMHTFDSCLYLLVRSWDCGISVLEHWTSPPPPRALPPEATLVTLSFVIHGWMLVVCVFSATCVGQITAAALNSGLITSHFTHLTSSPAPHNLLLPSIPSWLCFSSWTCPVLHPDLSSLLRLLAVSAMQATFAAPGFSMERKTPRIL